ncbi:hypothetical protein FWG95_03330 [Candidatus Saccharibacteria bacterium]|nr:hypothetical protein [Candidatus Saccharibacteria bacterium]
MDENLDHKEPADDKGDIPAKASEALNTGSEVEEKPYSKPVQEIKPSVEQQTPELATKANIFKKWLLYVLIAGLAAAGIIAVVAIIIGELSDGVVKAIWMAITSWVHTLIIIGILSISDLGEDRDDHRNVMTYTILSIVIASFVTTVMVILDIIPPHQLYKVGNLYGWYIGVIIGSLVVSKLLDYFMTKDKTTRGVGWVGVGFFTLFVLLFFPPTILDNLPNIYFRILLASSVVFSTLLIIAVVLGRVYLTKHPEAYEQMLLEKAKARGLVAYVDDQPYIQNSTSKGMPSWGIIILIIIGIMLMPTILSVVFGILGLLF